jgi:hypothetical protein
MRRSFVALIALAMIAGACARPSGRGGARAASDAPVVAAVGDIACNSLPQVHPRRCKYDEVAALIQSVDPDAYLALGDLQYLHGSHENFLAYYDRYFGPLKQITYPVPGNHETYTLYAEGYYQYFGKRAHPPGGYYSFDLGTWHVIALNSQICKGSTWNPDLGQNTPITRNPAIGKGCGPGTAMYEWAKKDLVLHQDDACTLAIMHHPLFGTEPWPAGVFLYQLQPLWELLDEEGVDVILAGHEHNYQRFAPQDAFGRVDANGITEFVVGTGGSTHNDLPTGAAAQNREAGQDTSYGVLKLTLNDGSYDFEFVPIASDPAYQDSGHAVCS